MKRFRVNVPVMVSVDCFVEAETESDALEIVSNNGINLVEYGLNEEIGAESASDNLTVVGIYGDGTFGEPMITSVSSID